MFNVRFNFFLSVAAMGNEYPLRIRIQIFSPKKKDRNFCFGVSGLDNQYLHTVQDPLEHCSKKFNFNFYKTNEIKSVFFFKWTETTSSFGSWSRFSQIWIFCKDGAGFGQKRSGFTTLGYMKVKKIKLGSRDIKIPLQVRKYNRGIIISDNSKPTLFVQVASYGVGGHFYLHHDPMFIYKEPEFLAKSVESRGKEQYITGSSLLPPPLCLVILSHQISSF